MAGKIARVEEQITLESKRVELNTNHEEAVTVVPARARREAMQLEAKGHASRIVEDGKASAQAVELMVPRARPG